MVDQDENGSVQDLAWVVGDDIQLSEEEEKEFNEWSMEVSGADLCPPPASNDCK